MELKAGCLWLLCGLAGCTMGPDYQKSVPVVPVHWQAEKDASLGLKPVTPEKLKTWWKNFGDSRLDRLMEQALTGNLDLKIALTRIDQARADRRSIRAELFPQIDITAGGQRHQNLSPIYARGVRFNLFELGFDALWEVDLFGRLQRRLEAASADLEAAEE
ncbi:MAG: TolC family protein, partial [Methylobacter sp.]|nr:TolC family protein [Methylobacter sp.]